MTSRSIKLNIIKNKKITDVYIHDCVNNYYEVITLLENFCDPNYVYDCGLTREKLYKFMLDGEGCDDGEEPIEDIVGYTAISLLEEFKHYDTKVEITADYCLTWNRDNLK